MIKSIVNRGEIESLNQLFNIYSLSNEEKEILHIAGKLFTRANEFEKERLIEIGDKVHEILLVYRNTFKSLYSEMEKLNYRGDFVEVRFLKSYIEDFSNDCVEIIKKLIKEMKKAYIIMSEFKYEEAIIFISIK